MPRGTVTITPLLAVQSLGSIPGSSQPQLVRAEDGNRYVVKFQNNPQGLRILANEMLGASIATLLGLPVPPVAVIEVPETMIRSDENMVIQRGRARTPCQAGLCFGSLVRSFGKFWLPNRITREMVENPQDFLGMLVFDKWTGNTDGRQVALVRSNRGCGVNAVMIDQGFCFAGEDWAFRDGTLQGVAYFPRIYACAAGLEDFKLWINRVEREISLETLREVAEIVPPEWYRRDRDALNQLVWQLNRRRGILRELIMSFLKSTFFAQIGRAEACTNSSPIASSEALLVGSELDGDASN